MRTAAAARSRRRPRRRITREPRSDAAPGRRRRLRQARRWVDGFAAENKYQRELQGLTRSMIGYMEDHWCTPGRHADFDRWWRLVCRYARALASPEMAGPKARKALARLIGVNQVRPADL